jgi:hypothetical protein
VVDQVLLGPPLGASAGQVTPAAPPAPTAQGPKPAARAASSDASVVDAAESLRDWNAQLVSRSAESPAPSPFAPLEAREPEESDVMSPHEFKAQHQLSGVMASGDIGIAMINGTAVRIGQEVGGYRLIRVDARSAEFRAGELTVRLELPQQVGRGS